MPTSAMLEVVQVIGATLAADVTLTGRLAEYKNFPGQPAIVNDIPEGQEYPLIWLGTPIETEWNTFGGVEAGIGWNELVRAHIYSRIQGELQAMEILKDLTRLLHYQTLTVAGYPTVITKIERSPLLRTTVKKVETRHIPVDVRVMVHQ